MPTIATKQQILYYVSERVFNVPLLITESKLSVILDVIGPKIGLQEVDSLKLSTSPEPSPAMSASTKPYAVSGNIGILPVYGTLVHRSGWLGATSGLRSYNSIRKDFDQALADPDIDTILLEFNSHGGEVSGCFDLVDHIYNSRGQKQIIAMVNESCYSAAYAIASAADKIYMTRTAGAGSIGVILIHTSTAKRDDNAGLKHTLITAGKHKADFAPHKELSADALKRGQELVDMNYDVFVATVARNRNMEEKLIRSTEAMTYHGKKAMEVGLADGIMSYQSVINKLKGGNKTMPKAKTTEKDPKLETQTETPPVEPKTAVIETPANTPAQLTKADIDAAIQLERDRAVAIMETCDLANTPELAKDLIADGSSIDVATKMAMSVLAERTHATCVVSSVNPAQPGGGNPLLANARKRAEAAKHAVS